MKRRMLALAVLGAAMWLTLPQEAAALGRRDNCCPSPRGISGACGTPCTQYTVSYVDKKVTAHKTEMETKDVKVKVMKLVDVKEDFKYTVMEPITIKKKVTVHEMKTKIEAVKYTVMEPITVKQMVKVQSCVAVVKDVEATVCEVVAVPGKQIRTVCEVVCVPTVVCRTSYDRCTGCPQTVQTTVMKRQTVSKQIEVDVVSYKRVEKKVMQKVTVMQPTLIDKEISVQKCVPVEKTANRTVCFTVAVEKEIDVASCRAVEKTGTRTVRKCVEAEETVKQAFCKVVPYETTVKVAVYTAVPVAAPAPCASPCNPCGMSGGCGSPCKTRCGLFSRLRSRSSSCCN